MAAGWIWVSSPRMRLLSRVCLLSLVVVEPDQHPDLSQHFLTGIDSAQGARHGPGGLGDDEGVPGIGLG